MSCAFVDSHRCIAGDVVYPGAFGVACDMEFKLYEVFMAEMLKNVLPC